MCFSSWLPQLLSTVQLHAVVLIGDKETVMSMYVFIYVCLSLSPARDWRTVGVFSVFTRGVPL